MTIEGARLSARGLQGERVTSKEEEELELFGSRCCSSSSWFLSDRRDPRGRLLTLQLHGTASSRPPPFALLLLFWPYIHMVIRRLDAVTRSNVLSSSAPALSSCWRTIHARQTHMHIYIRAHATHAYTQHNICMHPAPNTRTSDKSSMRCDTMPSCPC